MKIVPLTPALLALLEWQPEQESERSLHRPEDLLRGECFAGILDGVVMFAAGRVNKWQAWAVLSRHAKGHMISITRAMLRLLELHGREPIEMLVRCDFDQAHKWARMLGFDKAEFSEEYNSMVYVKWPHM